MANIVSISVTTLLLPMIVCITVAVFFIYKIFFDKHTNKVLESGEIKRKWIAPWGLALIVLGAQLLVVAGIMFPISMFIGYNTAVEVSESQPMALDLSDSVKFVIDESQFYDAAELTEDGITVTVYKRQRADGNEYSVIIGEIEKQKSEPMFVYVCLGTDNREYECETYLPGSSGSEKAYFKCEVLTGEDKPSSLRIAVDYGNSMDPKSDNLPQDVMLVI